MSARGAISDPALGAFASRIQAQVFPLLASRPALQRFCDRWFNHVVPPEVAVFRPSFPVVFCTVLSYREMGSELLWQTGAYAQRELYFLIFLDRYRRRGGHLEFVEHAATTPYIYVDNALSAAAGRERFGFGKQLCRFAGNAGDRELPWADDPEQYLSVSAWQPSAAGARLCPLLDIVAEPSRRVGLGRDPGRGPLVTPREPMGSPLSLLWWARTLAGEIAARSSPGPLFEARGVWRELQRNLRSGVPLNVYNLRQFADPQALGFFDAGEAPPAPDAKRARYQDLVRFRMVLRDIQEVRLFRERFVGTDFTLLLQRSAVAPIASRLGLAVWSRQRAGDADVDVLRAVTPFYGQLDVELAETKRVCWRFDDGAWHTRRRRLRPQRRAVFNAYLGPCGAVFLEPQREDGVVDVKFLLLAAESARVREALAALVPRRCDVAIEPIEDGGLSPVRLLLVRSRPRAAAEQEELVWLDGNYASLTLPVTFRREPGAAREHALLMLHDFTDNDFRMQALRQLAAGPTQRADFAYAAAGWFAATQEVAPMLRVSALALDRRAEAVRVTEQPLFDVLSRALTAAPAPAATLAAQADAISRIQPVLCFGAIPDAEDPRRVIERRLVLVRFDERAAVTAPVEDPSRHYFVEFHESETFPLARRLGLVSVARGDLPPVDRPGRTALCPVVRVTQAALRYRLTGVETLWRWPGREREGA